MPATLHIAVFASGQGSNLRAILGAIESGSIRNVRVVLTVSNNPESGALAVARERKISTLCIRPDRSFLDEEFNDVLLAELDRHGVNFIVLAGYLKKLAPGIVRRYKNRIINIHPALLPAFGGQGMYGMRVHEAVIASKAKISGATVHIVDEEYDHGPIVLQKSVAVADNETPQSLARKIQAIEHEIYPNAIRLFAEGKITVMGQRVIIVNRK